MDQTTFSPTAEPDGDYLLYDNECPFCSAYVRMVRLREAGVNLKLLEGRDHSNLVRKFARAGMDINKGMILQFRGQSYFGADAINRMALMSTPSGAFNVLNRFVFSNRIASCLLYPVLRAGRNATLKLLGRKPMNLD